RRIGELIGLPVEEQPDLLLQVEPSALGAAAYWHDNGLNVLADTGDVLGLGRKIN
ncbi:glycoside hydrolase family 19 protein, partial [Xanthomonas arboricola pv. corylina]